MVAIKFLGLILTFHMFLILETLGNFYPAQIVKRGENGSQGEKFLSEGRNNQEGLPERKIRFFVSGGRYGKRSCSGLNCLPGTKEILSGGFQNKQEKARLPIIRNSQYLSGSRLERQFEGQKFDDPESAVKEKELKCTYTGINDLYHCLNQLDLRDENELDSYFTNEFFQLNPN